MSALLKPNHVTSHDVTDIYGMSNDVREECLEFLMTLQEYLECLMTSKKNVTSQ